MSELKTRPLEAHVQQNGMEKYVLREAPKVLCKRLSGGHPMAVTEEEADEADQFCISARVSRPTKVGRIILVYWTLAFAVRRTLGFLHQPPAPSPWLKHLDTSAASRRHQVYCIS